MKGQLDIVIFIQQHGELDQWCKLLGWQGGTVHQVASEIKNLEVEK
jgi:hypothetical protein